MSRFFSHKYDALTPYVPGEQPRDMARYVKLNTNESPFPPSEAAMRYARERLRSLNLYSDPTTKEVVALLSKRLGVGEDEVLLTNGSDEILNFAFMAFCDAEHPAAFPDITYGFYPVFARLNGVEYEGIPLNEDFTVNCGDYEGIHRTIFIANPNAPTGIALSVSEIERIVASNPDNVVVIDEAYVDFGGESCVPLIHRYDNLLVTQTFSKSRSMAGGRLGFGVGCARLIADLNTIKYSTNPYNVNSLTLAVAEGILRDEETVKENCRVIAENRAFTLDELKKRGFTATDSRANFVFAGTNEIPGGELCAKLKEKGVLVRHFDIPRIREYLRITVGTRAQMEALLNAIDEIRREIK